MIDDRVRTATATDSILDPIICLDVVVARAAKDCFGGII